MNTETENNRRLMNLVVGSLDLMSLLSDRRDIITNLPADAAIVGYYASPEYDGLVLRIRSMEFQVIEPFMQIPYMSAEVHHIPPEVEQL